MAPTSVPSIRSVNVPLPARSVKGQPVVYVARSSADIPRTLARMRTGPAFGITIDIVTDPLSPLSNCCL